MLLYDGTQKIIEHENGCYSAQAFNVNIRKGFAWACSARSHFKPLLFSCTTVADPEIKKGEGARSKSH